MTKLPKYLYKILSKTGQPCNGGKGKWSLPPKAKWMPVVDDILICHRGYHLVKSKYICNWIGKGNRLFLAEWRGVILSDVDNTKYCVSQARLKRKIVLDRPLMQRVVRQAAKKLPPAQQKVVDRCLKGNTLELPKSPEFRELVMFALNREEFVYDLTRHNFLARAFDEVVQKGLK
jgi:hypothetical protein